MDDQRPSKPGVFVKGDPRAGRPKGTANKITNLQRHVAEMVLGKPGTPEFETFIALEREALLTGTMDPRIKQLWMHYGYGRPVERIEVKETTENLDGLTEEHLRERALALVKDQPLERMNESDDSVH